MSSLQEQYHGENFDYRRGSPHLFHLDLHDRLVGSVRAALRDVGRRLPLDVLEVGAGHGGFTEPVLALGASVTAVEMSRPSLERLEARFESNERFQGIFDINGDLAGVDGEFSAVLCVSVLHHIPDYLTFLSSATRLVRTGGIVLSLQDPLWYARVPKSTHAADRLAYYAWRARQGNARQALATLRRRLRGIYDEENPADMVEYHVVRQGVDEEAIVTQFEECFDDVELLKYWSTQSTLGQRLGTRLGLANTFAIVAKGKRSGAESE